MHAEENPASTVRITTTNKLKHTTAFQIKEVSSGGVARGPDTQEVNAYI